MPTMYNDTKIVYGSILAEELWHVLTHFTPLPWFTLSIKSTVK